jgi:hypothetical protein
VVQENIAKLSLSSNDLGVFVYELKLHALPAPPEKNVNFQTWLGNVQSKNIKFTSFAKTRTEYAIKVDNQEFLCDKTVAASAGNDELAFIISSCFSFWNRIIF